MQGISLLNNLVDRGLLSEDQSIVLKTESKRQGGDIETVLLDSGFIDHALFDSIRAEEAGMQPFRFDNLLIDAVAIKLIDFDTAVRYGVFPIYYSEEAERLSVAVSAPHDILIQDALNSLLHGKCGIEYRFARASDIARAIECGYEQELSIDGIVRELADWRGSCEGDASLAASRRALGNRTPEESLHPIVRLVDAIIIDAFRKRASDIHFEPEPGYFRIRYRVDGLLHTSRSVHSLHWPATATRLKVLAGLNIAETRAAQDGAFSLSIGSSTIDVRTSVFPTLHGENVVLRVLDPDKARLELADIGFDASTCQHILHAVRQPQGITLLVGPTGCGKTTTLYALLNQLADDTVNVMTLEDPVEYQLPMIRQCAVNGSSKLDFASGIRSILRQDPDIILVGEIRDRETAELSIRAAMTGHHVLATLHTPSALGVYRRLVELGVEPQVVAESVTAVISQRLLRLLCKHCKTPVQQGDKQTGGFSAVGCAECAGSGYLGRTAIAETLVFTAALRSLLVKSESASMIEAELVNTGHQSLYAAGLALIGQGKTSIDELHRVIGEQT